MSNISLTFVAHQPNRLIHYDFFKIGALLLPGNPADETAY